MTLLYIILATLAVSLVSFAGAIVLFWEESKIKNALSYFVSFAAGIMLAAAFLDLFPEALEAAGNINLVMTSALLGILAFFFLERFVVWFHHHDEEHGAKPSAVLILVGDGVHNFIDGVAIAAAFMLNPALGITAALAIAAHEIPQEIADFSVLLHGGMSKGKALLYNFLSALTALAGAILGFYFLEKLTSTLPIFLAFSAGMFIYIACSDLIPDLHHEFKQDKKWTQSIPFVLGIVLLGILIKWLE